MPDFDCNPPEFQASSGGASITLGPWEGWQSERIGEDVWFFTQITGERFLRISGILAAETVHLIEAVHELHAVVRELVKRYDVDRGFYECSHEDLVTDARAAIAKAKGGRK